MELISSAASWHYQWLLSVHNSAVSALAGDLFALPLLLQLLSGSRAQHFFLPSVCLSHPALPVTLPQAAPPCCLTSPRLLSQNLPPFLDFYPHMLSPQNLPHLILSLRFLNCVSNSLVSATWFPFQLPHWSLFQHTFHVVLCPDMNWALSFFYLCPVVLSQQLGSKEEVRCQIWFLIIYLFNP